MCLYKSIYTHNLIYEEVNGASVYDFALRIYIYIYIYIYMVCFRQRAPKSGTPTHRYCYSLELMWLQFERYWQV
jgi:hypothetical protein